MGNKRGFVNPFVPQSKVIVKQLEVINQLLICLFVAIKQHFNMCLEAIL